ALGGSDAEGDLEANRPAPLCGRLETEEKVEVAEQLLPFAAEDIGRGRRDQHAQLRQAGIGHLAGPGAVALRISLLLALAQLPQDGRVKPMEERAARRRVQPVVTVG